MTAICKMAVLLLALTSVSAPAIAAHTAHSIKPTHHSLQHIQGVPWRSHTLFRPSTAANSVWGPADSSFPVYPKGDCATQCSVDPAARMAHCTADLAAGIPATQCQAVDGSETDICPSVRYPDAL